MTSTSTHNLATPATQDPNSHEVHKPQNHTQRHFASSTRPVKPNTAKPQAQAMISMTTPIPKPETLDFLHSIKHFWYYCFYKVPHHTASEKMLKAPEPETHTNSRGILGPQQVG